MLAKYCAEWMPLETVEHRGQICEVSMRANKEPVKEDKVEVGCQKESVNVVVPKKLLWIDEVDTWTTTGPKQLHYILLLWDRIRDSLHLRYSMHTL